MTREETAALVTRRLENFRDHDADALAADFAEDAVLDTPSSGQSCGRDAIRAAHESFVCGFDDIQIEQEHLVIDGDEVVMIFKFRGTHTGTFLGVPATGKKNRLLRRELLQDAG